MKETTLAEGISPDVPDHVYHADNSLSSSGARQLLKTSPAHFHYQQTHPRPYVAAFEVGHAAHMLATGTGSPVHVVDAKDWRTKAAKEERDQAIAQGETPLLQAEWDKVRAMADALLDHPTAGEFLTRGDIISEVSMKWTDPDTEVDCRARPDIATRDWSLLIDYKTTVCADPTKFTKSIAEYGYHAQAAWYMEACEMLTFHRPRFVFIAQEKEPPYAVSVCEVDEAALRLGDAMNRAAREIYRDCTNSGIWPAYGNDIHTLTLPNWAFTQMENTL